MADQTHNIPKGWKMTTLGEVAEIFTGRKDVNQTDLSGKYIFFSCSPETFYSNEYIRNDDAIIIVGNGSYTGTVRFFSGKFDLYQRTYACVLKSGLKNEFDIKFIYYYVKKYFEASFMGGTRGSSIPYIVRGDIEDFKIPNPPLPEQRAIAAVLSAFDDKIELLREQNKTLEATAQAIFKEWFVRFNFPDKNGKPYKASGGKMIDSELGEIPEGWRVGKLEEFIEELIPGEWGQDIADAEYSEKVICLRGTDLPDLNYGSVSRAPFRYVKKAKLEKAKIKPGDLVIEISGGTIGQSTGRVAYFNEEIYKRLNSDVVSSNFCKVLRLKDISNQSFLYFYWEYLYKTGLFFNYENGTTGIQNLDLKGFLQSELVLPSEKIVKNFCLFGEKTLFKVQNNNSQIQTLSKLRDTLLPKLMKGEVRVKEYKN